MTHPQPTTHNQYVAERGRLQTSPDDDGHLVQISRDSESLPTGESDHQRRISNPPNPGAERLTQPLIRRGSSLSPTSWDTALGIVTARLVEALSKSADNVAVLGSGRQTTEAAYALGKVARGAFGTRHYDANTTLSSASTAAAYRQAFGCDGPPLTYDDIPRADTHVVWGANPALEYPGIHSAIQKSATECSGKLIVIDPIETESATNADLHIRPKLGTDLALARAVLADLVGSGSIDERFVDAHTDGYTEMLESLPSRGDSARRAGVSPDRVHELTEALTAETIIYGGLGITQSDQPTQTARAVIDLCLATKNVGPHSGPLFLAGYPNALGLRTCASIDTWPGERVFEDPLTRRTMADAWDVNLDQIPDSSGPGYIGIIDAIARENLDVCWAVRANPLAEVPGSCYVESALEETFLISQAAFRSETTDCADVVLPTASWRESVGTVMNMDRCVSRVTASADPPGKARQGIDLIAAIGNRISTGLFDSPPLDSAAVFDELRDLTTGTKADLSGISYNRLDSAQPVRWPARGINDEGNSRYHGDGNWVFDTDTSRAQFSTGTHSRRPEPVDEEYPLTATLGRTAADYGGSREGHPDPDAELPTARMNPETVAQHLDMIDRGRTVISSRRSAVTVSISPTDSVPPGVIWLPTHRGTINDLTLRTVDLNAGEPNLMHCAVRLSPGVIANPDDTPHATD